MGALLRALRKQGHTQQAMADALGCDQTYVSQLMKSPDGIPRGIGAELVRKMLDEYRVNPWYFFDFPRDKLLDVERYLMTDRPPQPPSADDKTHIRKKA